MEELQTSNGEKKNSLWTKNFTIITVGTVISMIGNAVAGFALGLLVLDYTGSTFLYALYMVMYSLPDIIMPTLAGPFVDKFSRRRTIYILDFISAAAYGIFAWLIISGHFNYAWLIIGCLLLGSIDSIYQVAYNSFYPMLISEGNYSKAYSIQSTLDSLTMVMVPVSAFLYNVIGIAPLFLINMVSFFIAAVFETQIKVKETYVKKEDEVFGFQQYKKTFREGMEYLNGEKGLKAVTFYFMISSFAGAAYSTIALPYFKNSFPNGEYVYISVMAWMCLGRIIGGSIHYKFRFPTDKKFIAAMIVYIVISAMDGAVLYMPLKIMMLFCFMDGILGVTSYNIRVSATQSYVPDDRKGRFNGIFQMLCTIGMLVGEFLAGVLTLVVPERGVVSIFMAINLVSAIVIMGSNRKHVKKIYNREA